MTPLQTVARLLRERIGLDPETLGEGGLAHAIRVRRRERRIEADSEYLSLLRSDAQEWDALIDAVVVPETWFFRDREPFALLTRRAGREWAGRNRNHPVCVLSLPCATGEEAWSIAIALAAGGLPPDAFRIDAFDLSERSLGVARAGVYRPRSLRGKQIDPDWSAMLISRPDGYIEVAPELRSSVTFTRGNLREARALLAGRRYDGILSRNLLMYCDQATRADALATFVELLRPDGLLFLGHAESIPAGTPGLVREGSPAAFAWRRVDATATDRRAERPRRPVAADEEHVAPAAPRIRRVPLAMDTTCTAADPLSAARVLADRGELAEAAALVSARLDEAPADASACVLLGIVLAAQGHDDEAAEQLRRSLYLEPENEDAMVHLALILDRAGQAKAAARLRDRARRREAER